MAKQEVDIGVEGNDGTGDSIRESFRKVNENFEELYAVFGEGGQITFTSLGDTPEFLQARTIPLVDDAAQNLDLVKLASDTQKGEDTDSVIISYDQAGYIILSTAFRRLSQDPAPVLGAPLDARQETVDDQGNILPVSIALGPNSVTQDAVSEFNRVHSGNNVTIDDLAITKGYADARYIAGELPIRIKDEPADASEYILTIEDYDNGRLVISDHGFERTINGTAFVYNAEDVDATNLVSGTTYYLRYYNSSQLSIHTSRADAVIQSQSAADQNRIVVSGTIAADDTHTLTDAGFDNNLEGFFLSDEAMPRKSIVRRQGDTMDGPLILHDSPGELAGLTSTPSELQAATKFYVDNTAYASQNNLFVSTKGDDSMRGVPQGKEGTSFTYAYASINAACRRAEEMMKASEAEPGPYMQTITINNGAGLATVVSQGTSAETGISPPVGQGSPLFSTARQIIDQNRQYIIREVTGYLNYTYPDFDYNIETCERDLGLILDAIAFDINRSESTAQNTANSLTRRAAERYYANASGRIAITRQQTETVDAINTARDMVLAALVNRPLNQTAISSITNSAIAKITTSVPHGLQDKNIIIVKDVVGLTELNNNLYYVKVITNDSIELFTDVNLENAVDTSTFATASGGNIGLRYQTDDSQYIAGSNAEANAINGVRDKFNLVTNIIQNGIDAGTVVNFGQSYYILVNPGDNVSTDQAIATNRDVIPGKIIVGKLSGAQGRVVNYFASDDPDNPESSGDYDLIEVHLLKPIDFTAGEGLEYGNFVNRRQVTIFVETGQYEEDYPIKVPANVSIKGDEFRRVIIRPKDRVSQSKWASTYIYRDREFDGLTLNTNGYRFYNQVNEWQGHFGYHYLSDPEKPLNVGSTVVNAGGFEVAADILNENKQFIIREVISYINNNSVDILYDHDAFKNDLEAIISGITYDMVLGTTYNQTLYGLKFQREKSPWLDSQIQDIWVTGLTEAKRLVAGITSVANNATALSRCNNAFDEIIDIIQNGELDTDTAANNIIYGAIPASTTNGENAKNTLQANRDFIAAEGLAFLQQVSPGKYINDAVRLRDFKNLVDALSYEILYGGWFATAEFTRDLFFDIDTLRLEIATRSETIETLERLKLVLEDVLLENAVIVTQGNSETQDTSGTPVTSAEVDIINARLDQIIGVITDGNTLNIANNDKPNLTGGDPTLVGIKADIDSSYTSIESQVVTHQDASPAALFSYNATKCARDVGLIVDALIDDLIRGGSEFCTEVQGQYQSSYISAYNGNGFGGQEYITKQAIDYITDIADRLFDGAYDSVLIEQDPLSATYTPPDFQYGTGEVGADDAVVSLINKITKAFDRDYNPPLRNDQMDCFLMNDATILRNITCQGHGGFLCVLDPDGQILTKSPYIQTGSSFSKSINAKTFAGGMFVDAYAGNIPVYIPETIDPDGEGAVSGKVNNYELWVRSEPGQGLFIREPQLPCPFYVEGRRYQVNAISRYSQGNGWCKIHLDNNSNEGAGYNEADFNEKIITLSTSHVPALGEQITQANSGAFGTIIDIRSNTEIVVNNVVGTFTTNAADTISGSITGAYSAYPTALNGLYARNLYLQTAGNRSMLGNDFTQINDLGYALVTNNGAFSEMVSMFTYYCHAAYYAKNGSEIRSLNGSNGYGNFGLVAEGADPNEIPDQITYAQSMTYPLKTFTFVDGAGDTSNLAGENAIFVYDAAYPPNPNSILEINHGGSVGTLRYRISSVSEADISPASPPSNGVLDNTVYRLQITGQPLGENGDFFNAIQDDLPNGTLISYRSSETHVIGAVRDKNNIVDRPSTAINFDESDTITYRSISFAGSDNYGTELAADEVQTTFNLPYDVIEIAIDYANAGSGKGLAPGDTTIAILPDGDADGNSALEASDILRLTRDIAGRQPGEANYAGGMIFSYKGRTHQIINYTDNGGNSADLTIASSPVHDITSGGTGLAAAVEQDLILYAALPLNSTAEVTINISLCRATGHDFTQIGTGGFNTSNYPNVILGNPVGGLQASLAPFYEDSDSATKAQVWERRKGRVFWMSTDQYGFFRVGQFFSIDQAQGSINFSGELGITNANELGFKKGVVVDEFSIDDTMADESDNAVPVEKAIVSYINKRLGRDKVDNFVTPLGPGFVTLTGTTEMSGELKMGTNKIINVADPTNGSDAATKDYVDTIITENDNYEKLRETTKSNVEPGDWVVYSGLRKAFTELPDDTGPGTQTLEVNDNIQNSNGTVTGVVKDVTSDTDAVIGEGQPGNTVYIITYELTSAADFQESETIYGTGGKSTVEAQILRGPFDELINAKNSANSDFDVTFTRTAGVIDDNLGATAAEFDFQLNKVIENADVTDNASIEQSKLLMKRAKPKANSSGLYGTNDDAGQADRGLAAFDDDNFTQEIQIFLSGTIAVSAGDILYQGTKQAVVVNSFLTQNQGLVRTSDTWTIDPSTEIQHSTRTDGRINAAQTLTGITVTNVKDSGYIGLKDRSVGITKLSQISSGYLLGRAERDTPDTGDVEPVIFDTIVDQGLALQDKDFNNAQITSISGQKLTFTTRVSVNNGEKLTQVQGGTTIEGTVQGAVNSEFTAYVTNVVVQGTTTSATFQQGTTVGDGLLTLGASIQTVDSNFSLIGSAMVRQEDGVYGTTPISTGSANNSIVRRTSNGSIQATSIIVGGSSTNTILSVSSNTLNVTTPQGANIFSASGASTTLPTMDVSGNVEIGNIGYNTGESVLKDGSTWGATGGADPDPQLVTSETSSLAVRWIYSSFIEAPSEKGQVGGGTGIGLGSGTATPSSLDGVIALICSGDEIIVADQSDVKINAAITTDDALTISGNLTIKAEGDLSIRNAANTADTFLVDGGTGNTTITGTLGVTSNISGGGTLAIGSSATIAGGYGNTGTSIDTSGNISTNGNLTVDGNTIISGNVDLGSNTVDTISVNGYIDTNVIPDSNGTRNLGSSGNRWGTVYGNTFSGTATTARYADLAENYLGDADYEPGTVLVLGGDAEVTITDRKGDRRVAGVVTTNPAHLMNSTLEGEHVTGVALQGRVPCKVLGKVSKGDILVTSAVPGYACVDNNPTYGSVIGKAIEDKDDTGKGVIEVLVGKA